MHVPKVTLESLNTIANYNTKQTKVNIDQVHPLFHFLDPPLLTAPKAEHPARHADLCVLLDYSVQGHPA